MADTPDFSQIPESDCIINYIADRYRKGLYTLTLVTGLPGTGKSSACLRLAELTSIKLHGENRITPDNVLESNLDILKALRETKKPGKIFVVEEMSVLFPSRRAMASENVTVGRILDTCRKKQVILFANAPIFTSIDNHARSMAHILVETQKILKTQAVVVSKAWRLQTNPHTGKCYRHRFLRGNRDVNLFYTRKPDNEVWEEYEKRKDKFLDNLYDRLQKQQQKKQDREDKNLGISPKRVVIQRPPTEKELKAYNLVRVNGLKLREAAEKLGVGTSRVFAMVQNVEKKTQIQGETPKKT